MLFSFDNFALDPGRRELLRAGKPIAVEPQVFDLLLYLIENRARVVSRDDLIASVWRGRIVSESTLASRINAARRAIGDDGARQQTIRTVARKGIRFVADVQQHEAAARTEKVAPALVQSVTFCRTADGVNVAIGTVGEGPPLVKTANWLNHLEYDWKSPIWSPLFLRFASRFRFIRFDGRGNGLADRDVPDISFDAFGKDLDAVAATIPDRKFALMGLSQGAAGAIAYAVRHPERVSCLVVYGGYAQGRNRRNPSDRAAAETLLAMMRQGWGDERSPFMRAFSSIYLPNGTAEQVRWFADMQQIATSGEVAARLRSACDDIDVLDLLPRVAVPTLVIHARDEKVVPYEQGRLIAASIPGAKLTTLESENHVPLPGEPAWEIFVSEIESFVAAHAAR